MRHGDHDLGPLEQLLVITLAWLATSLALHQLLTFYKRRPEARIAAHKKFIVSRLADACMLGLPSSSDKPRVASISTVLHNVVGAQLPVSVRCRNAERSRRSPTWVGGPEP